MKRPMFCGAGAHIIGDITFGEDCGVWYNAVIRGDCNPITIGNRVNIQDNCTLHVSQTHTLTLGNDVTVGHNTILHGCTIEDNVLVGMGAIVMDGAIIRKNALIAAGALVPSGTEIPEGMLAMGNPAKVRRPLTDEEIEGNRRSAENYLKHAKRSLEDVE